MELGTPKASKVVGTLGLLVVGALGWTFVLGPESGSLADARAEVDAARQQNTVLLQQLSQLKDQEQELQQTRRMARELQKEFPPTADQPGLFQQVTKAAVDAGIGADGVTTLAPSPPVIGSATGGVSATQPTAGSASLASQDVSVSVTGSYDQTEELLRNLERMPRAYLVTSVSLAGGGEAATGVVGDTSASPFTTTIAGQMFVMPPIPDPDDAGTTQ